MLKISIYREKKLKKIDNLQKYFQNYNIDGRISKGNDLKKCYLLRILFETNLLRPISFFRLFQIIQTIIYQIYLLIQAEMTDKNSNHIGKSNQHTHLKQMSTQQLKKMLYELQKKNDMLQIKNQQLGNQANDLRKIVRCVQNQREQQIEHSLMKKKKLQTEIERLEKALKISHNNDQYKKMIAYKDLLEE